MSDASRRSTQALARAWPYRAVPFGPPVRGLGRTGPRCLDGETQALRASLEPKIVALAHGASLASLHALVEQTWFPNDATQLSLAEHLASVAAEMLEARGPAIRLAERPPDARAYHADLWRRLSLQLPVDLLVAARCPREPTCDHVELLDPQLARVLESRVAETHLHLGAGVDFGVLWVAIGHDLAWGPERVRNHDDAGDGLGGGAQHVRVLRAAMLARHVILMFCWHRSEGWDGDFAAFLRRWLADIMPSNLGSDARWSLYEAFDAAWTTLHIGKAERSASEVEMLGALRFVAGGRRPKVDDIGSLIASDPAARWLVPRSGLARPETRLLWHALAYLRGAGVHDRMFADMFWQYVRVRCLVHGRLVQTPGLAGLDWFARHYERISQYRGVLDQCLGKSARSVVSRCIGLGSLEVRSGLPSDREFVQDVVSELAQVPQGEEIEFGLIFHFIKTRESSGDATPARSVYRTRFGDWYHRQLVRARVLGRLLDARPELLLVFRGLDVASSEMGVPNWPLVPLFGKLRAHADSAALDLVRRWPSFGLEGISTTMHLGEEFRRPSDALRRVHEAVEFGLLRAGDRIGHGLVLGWNLKDWALTNPCVAQPREERLDDLLWTLDRLEARHVSDREGRHPVVRAEAMRLIEGIYGQGVALEQAQAARRQRFDPDALWRLDYPYGHPGVVTPDLQLLHRHLTDLGTYQRGAELIEVHVDDDEVAFLERIQLWLRQQLALLGITIESNPSSNLLIGDFPDLRDHPTFRLSPLPGSTAPLEGRLPVSINTDDPITFATCLADEYAHMYFALIGQGVPTRDALAWLDQAREAGWRSRFTLPASADPEVLRVLLGRGTRDG